LVLVLWGHRMVSGATHVSCPGSKSWNTSLLSRFNPSKRGHPRSPLPAAVFAPLLLFLSEGHGLPNKPATCWFVVLSPRVFFPNLPSWHSRSPWPFRSHCWMGFSVSADPHGAVSNCPPLVFRPPTPPRSSGPTASPFFPAWSLAPGLKPPLVCLPPHYLSPE